MNDFVSPFGVVAMRAESSAVGKALEAIYTVLASINKDAAAFCDSPVLCSPRANIETIAQVAAMVGAHGVATFCEQLLESVSIIEQMGDRGASRASIQERVRSFQGFTFALGKYIEEAVAGKSPPIKPLRHEFEKMYRENRPGALATRGVDGLASIMRCAVVVGTEVGVDDSFDREMPQDMFLAALRRFEEGGAFELTHAPLLGLGLISTLLALASQSGEERVLPHARAVASRLRAAVEERSPFAIDWEHLSMLVTEMVAGVQTGRSLDVLRRFEVSSAGMGEGTSHEAMRKLLEKIRELQAVFNKAVTQRAPKIIAGPAKMVSDFVANLGVPALALHAEEFHKLCDAMAAGDDSWESWVAAAKRLILIEESVIGWGSPATQDALLRSSVAQGVVNEFMIERATRQALKSLKASVLKGAASMRGAIDSAVTMMAQGKSEQELSTVLDATSKEIARAIPILEAFFWTVGCPKLERAVTELAASTSADGRLTFLTLRAASEKLSIFDGAVNSIVFGNQAHVDAEFGAMLNPEVPQALFDEAATDAALVPPANEQGGVDDHGLTSNVEPFERLAEVDVAEVAVADVADVADVSVDPGTAIETEEAGADPEMSLAAEPQEAAAMSLLDFSLEVDAQPARGAAQHYDEFLNEEERAGARNVIDPEAIDQVLAGIMVDECEGCMFAVNGLVTSGRIDEEGWRAVKRHVHTMKGVLRTCGLMDCGSALHRLEDQLDLLDDDAGMEFVSSHQAGFRDLLDFVNVSLDAARVVAGRIEPRARDIVRDGAPSGGLEVAPATAQVDSLQTDAASDAEAGASAHRDPQPQMPARTVPAASVTTDVAVPPQALMRVPATALQAVVAGVGDTERLAQTQRESVDVVATKLSEMAAILDRLASHSKALAALSAADAAAKGLQHGGLDQFGPLQATNAGVAETVRDLGLYVGELTEHVARLRNDGRSSVQRMERMSSKVSELLLVELSTQQGRIDMACQRACSELGKSAGVVIERGAQLPTAVIDKMGPAIEHVIRNAVAHGIESPTDRLALGKPALGRIVLRAGQAQGGMIALEIADDGAGINRERVIASAIERGIIRDGQALSDQDVYQLLMVPGFSTAESVTSVAGRGVGLDAVRDTVVTLGGSLTIRSAPGQGTVFVLMIPTGESMMSAVPVWALDQACLIPSAFVVRVMPVGDLVDDGFGRAVLPEGSAKIIRLSDLLPVAPRAGVTYDEAVVVTRDPTGIKAVIVNQVGHKLRVSPQALPPESRSIPGLMGVARTSQTHMAFIVNPGLMKPAAKTKAAIDTRPVVLVADDSPTIRAVNAKALEAAGFRVILAKDGLAAQASLQADPTIAVLVTDIEMPGMSGLELIREVRAGRCGRQDLRAMIVSSRTGEQQQAAAKALGVEIIGKPADPVAVAEKARRLLQCAKLDGDVSNP